MSMSESAKSAATDLPQQGIFVTGEFFSLTAGKPYNRRDGTEVLPYKLAVAVGDGLVRIEVESGFAESLVKSGTQRGTTITVPVWVDGAWDPASRKRSAVFFRGR